MAVLDFGSRWCVAELADMISRLVALIPRPSLVEGKEPGPFP